LETVVIAAEETERLIRLAEDLLVLSRDQAPAHTSWVSFDVMSVIDDSRAMVAAVAARHEVNIDVRGADVVMVHGDADRIRQAVDNVLVNAERFAPPGSTITITATNADGRCRIEVLDEGPGFSPELLPHVFERFRRGDTVRTREGPDRAQSGTGLGLSIVRNVLRSHGGDAVVGNRSAAGGARVRLEWPTSHQQMADGDEQS
jgi:signal transduction histidine kinase